MYAAGTFGFVSLFLRIAEKEQGKIKQ